MINQSSSEYLIHFKTCFQHPNSYEEIPVQLSESHIEVADDYTKRKNVFRIKTENGSEYLFQVRNG